MLKDLLINDADHKENPNTQTMDSPRAISPRSVSPTVASKTRLAGSWTDTVTWASCQRSRGEEAGRTISQRMAVAELLASIWRRERDPMPGPNMFT